MRVEVRFTRGEKHALDTLATIIGLSIPDVVRQLIRERFDELKQEAA